jgi:uncharacterized protein (DUF488 family)
VSSSRSSRGPIFTIGYEGASAEEVIETLRAHNVDVLLDARYRPSSRKRGLSKTPLSEACDAVEIEYRHDRGLGTPPEIMKKLREEGEYDWVAYRAFLHAQTGSLASACELARQHRVCLLCYEADASTCHRSIVAEEMAARTNQQIEHLAPAR